MLKSSTRLWLRSVVLGLLVLAWWNPVLPWGQAPRDIIVLWDDSLSMERTSVASAWSRLVEGMPASPAGSRFALLRFATAPVLEVPLTDIKAFPAALPPRLYPLDRSASNLEAALTFGLRLADPRRSPAVVLPGSMDQAEAGISRLALARRAMTETASSLLASDRIGLLAFDVQPRVLVPLDTYQHPAQVLDAAWQIRAAGGTRLGPALLAALEQLRIVQTDQRLLVLVTDGFVEGEDFTDIEQQLAAGKITVIALAVGDADPTVLQRLARYNEGKLLRVRELATLPRLMHQEVEKKRIAMETGPVVPRQTKPLPYTLVNSAWPALQAYMVTKARPGASVYLQSPQGDPLLAMQQTGAGRVLVLPGGLSAWANAWLQWPAFGRLLGGLLEWIDSHTGDPSLEFHIQDRPGELEFSIDTLGEDQDWSSTQDVGLTLRDPADRLLEITPELRAPGHYVAIVPVQQPGQYRATARIGSHATQQDILHMAYDELAPPTAGSQVWESWLKQGLLQPWSKDSLTSGKTAPDSLYLRTVLLVLAGFVYLGLLVVERGLLTGLAQSHWLRIPFPKREELL